MKFRFEKGKMHLTVTSLQCQCLSWLMIDQGNLWKPKPTKIQKQIKGNHDRTVQPVRFRDPGMAARIQGKFGG